MFGNSITLSSEEDDISLDNGKGKTLSNYKMPDINNVENFQSYIETMKSLNIDVVVAIGSRIKIDLIGLYLKKTGLTYIKQFEDDEETIFYNCNPNINEKPYTTFLKDGYSEILDFVDLKRLHTSKYRIIDPYLKGLTLSIIDGYTKIWGGLVYDEEKYLQDKKFFSLPPVCSSDLIFNLQQQNNMTVNEDQFFVAGSIYSKEDAEIFLEAWGLFHQNAKNALLKISKSRTSKKVLEFIEQDYHGKNGIELLDLPNDEDYQKVLMSSNFIVSVGGGEFDEKRLPSRLIKAMFLGKVVVLPSVGFGGDLMHRDNAMVCEENSKTSWHKTLVESYEERYNRGINQKAIAFASENFDVQKVAYNFSTFISTVKKETTKSVKTDTLVDIQKCMMADYLTMLNNNKLKSNPGKISRIKFRIVISGDCLFLQTLDRKDYSYQVDSSANSIKSNNKIKDSGFRFLLKNDPIKLHGQQFDNSITKSELAYLYQCFRPNYLDLNAEQRSRLFDKFLLSFKLFKIVNKLSIYFKTPIIIFHADMQSVEAIVSNLFNIFTTKRSTASLQHAIYSHTDETTNINIVNSIVSPSKFTFFWAKHVSELVCTRNPDKIPLLTKPIPSYILSNIDFLKTQAALLVVLDGPDNDDVNNELIGLCDELVANNIIGTYDIKPHPYHNTSFLNEKSASCRGNLVFEVSNYYSNVLFITSTLGYEFSRFGFNVHQFVSEKLPLIRTTPKDSSMSRFSNYQNLGELVRQRSKNNSAENCNILHPDEYKKSFNQALNVIRENQRATECK